MPKNYWLKSLLFSLIFPMMKNGVAQVKFKVELLADEVTYQVSLYSEVDYPTAVQNVTTSAQITLVAPTGGFSPGSIKFLRGNWSPPDVYVNPISALNRDYFIFTLTNIIDDLDYQESVSYPLFTFINEGTCTGPLELMDNDRDPFAESQIIATKNFITIFGNGLQNAFSGVKDAGNAPCTLARPDCDLEFVLEASSGGYKVSLVSDTTLVAPNNITSSAVVTLRVPTGSFTVNNVINAITGAIFELSTVEINPVESSGFDYLFFAMDNPSLTIPYTQGDTVELFSFEHSSCVGDSIYLVGEGATIPTPIINGESATSYIFVSGYGLEGAPLCIGTGGLPICELMPAPKDTLQVILNFNDTITLCIDSALQLPNNVGNASICTQGTNVAAVVSNNDSCITLQPSTNFFGEDTLCVTHCDGLNENYCDTSVLIISVEEPVVVEPITCVLNYAIEFDSGKYKVSLLSDTTWPAFPSGLTRALQITLRAPTGQLQVENIEDANGAVAFEVSNMISNPVETPGYDYISFGLKPEAGNVPNPFIPYVKGQKVDLFSFQNFECSLDSAYLVGEGAPFSTPLIGGIDVNSSADVTGWTSIDQELPVCISSMPLSLCDPDAKLDTVHFSLDENTNQFICLDEVLNLLDTVGDVQICQQGQAVSAAITQGSPCLTLMPSTDFTGFDTLCVVHCGAVMADFCDTTYITVAVERKTCDVVLLGVSPNSLPSCGERNGVLEVNAVGSNLQYSLDTGGNYQNTSFFSNLAAGIYTIVVRDSVNTTCQDTLMYAFLGIAQPSINSVSASVPSACNANDGSINISASGGSNLMYSIDSGQTYVPTNIFNNLSAGVYTIFVSSSNGFCVEEYDFNPIIFTPCIFECTISAGSDVTICAGDSTNLLAVGNGDQYNWEPATGLSCINCPNPKAFPTTTTTYIVTNTHTSENCSSQDTITVSVNSLNFTLQNTHPSECNNTDGSIIFDVSNNGSGLIYSIDGGNSWSSDSVFGGLVSGDYTARVAFSDTSCLSETQLVSLANSNTSIDFTVQSSDPSACNMSNGSITLSAGRNGLIYSIDNGLSWSMSNTFTGLGQGNYSVLVADSDTSCLSDIQIVVLNSITAPVINDVTTINPSTCGLQNGSIEIIASGSNPLEYSINNGTTWQNSGVFNNLGGGFYTILVRYQDETCLVQHNSTVELTAPNAFGVLTPIDNIANCTENSLPLSITLSENITSYVLNTGNIINANLSGTTLAFDAIIDGDINEFSISFSNGVCEVTETFVIYKTLNIEADFVVIEPFCKEMEVSIRFTGNASSTAQLQWELDGGILLSASPATATAPAGGEILVRWLTEGSKLIHLTMNDGGCTDEQFESIFVRKLPLVDAGQDQTICENECIQLEGSGTGVWYTWNPADGLSATDIPNPTACPDQTRTYTLTVMSADGCVAVDSLTIFVEDNFASVIADSEICAGESTILGADGGISYSWSPAVSLNDPTAATPIATPLVTTTYTVSVTNASGCTDEKTVTVTVNPAPKAIACADKTICRGDSIQLVVDAHSSYAWSPTNSLLNPNTGIPIAFPTETTVYTVTVTDENGCTDTDEVVVFVDDPIIANAGNDMNICAGESAQLQATGGFSYLWQPTTGLNATNIANPIATPLITTTYTVLVTGVDGCTDTDEITVFVNHGTGINAGMDQILCAGESIQLNATGGSNYNWVPAAGLSATDVSSPIATPLSSTAYIVSGIGTNGCRDADTVIVNVIPKPEAVACEDKTICLGDSIQLVVTTHSAYAWSPTSSLLNSNTGTPTAFPTETTTYTVTVTDENGCTDTDEVVVFVNKPAVDLGPDINLCQNDFAQLNATGGIDYLWTPAEGLSNPTIPNPIATPTQTTTYSVLVTDANGCIVRDEITIFINSMIADAGPSVVLCPGESGQLSASGGIAYSWSPTTGLNNPNIPNPTVMVDQVTTYTVTVTDANGCTDTDETQAIVSLPFMVDPIITPADCCGKGGSVLLNVSGGYGNNTFEWTPNVSSTNNASNLDAGTYKVIITDAQGCQRLYTINIIEDCAGCQDIFSEKEICVEDTADIVRICVPIPPANISAYEVTIDGTIYTPNHGCGFENFLAYSYALVEGQGEVGNYRIDSWTVDGITFSGQVDNMQELTNWMNANDPGGNWTLNEGILSITGGNPVKDYGNIEIVQLDRWVETTMRPNITGLATGSIVKLNLGTNIKHEIIVTDTLTCCSDTLIIKRCEQEQPCANEIIREDIFEEMLMDCNDLASICIDLDAATMANYQIEINNTDYTGPKNACANGTGMQLFFGLGQHQVALTNKENGCQDRFIVNVLCAENKITDATIRIGEKGQYCLAEIINEEDQVGNITTTTIICANAINPVVAYLPAGENCFDYQGLAIGSDTLCLKVCTDLNRCFNVQMVVNVLASESDPGSNPECENFIGENALSANLSNCDSLASFCIDIPFDSIGLYTITQNEGTFNGMITNCESNTYVNIGPGIHNIIFQHQQNTCIDSLSLAVHCITRPSFWADTIEVGEQFTFCPEPDDLIGEIKSIENICANTAGIAVNFDINDTSFCLDYEGLTTGSDLACLVLCDELGVCDTIYFSVLVTPKVVRNPIAIRDVDTTEENKSIVIEVLANDSVFGNPQNMGILTEPANGIAMLNIDHTITFTPSYSYCDSGTPEIFMYGVCNDTGCDTAIVEVWIPCQEMKIFTGFSPNNDGVNDFFRIQGVHAFPNNNLKIFNRWGSMVFSQKGYKNQWDGKWENKNLPDGTYFYLFKDGKGKTYSGYLQLAR